MQHVESVRRSERGEVGGNAFLCIIMIYKHMARLIVFRPSLRTRESNTMVAIDTLITIDIALVAIDTLLTINIALVAIDTEELSTYRAVSRSFLSM